jgi:hypothetical protein
MTEGFNGKSKLAPSVRLQELHEGPDPKTPAWCDEGRQDALNLRSFRTGGSNRVARGRYARWSTWFSRRFRGRSWREPHQQLPSSHAGARYLESPGPRARRSFRRVVPDVRVDAPARYSVSSTQNGRSRIFVQYSTRASSSI